MEQLDQSKLKHNSNMVDWVRFRCHPKLVVELERAADKRFMTVSEYVRQAIMTQLKADKT